MGWVEIGRLYRARGIRGELLGELDSSKPGRENDLTEVTLEREGRRRVVRVEQVWRHLGRPVFKFEGIDTMTDAEAWEGSEILAPESEVVAPEDGEFSHAALVGSQVVKLAGGETIGVVQAVEEFGGPPLLNVRTPDGRDVLIPFVHEICRSIDAEAKRIGVELPEGLLELQ